MAFIDGGLVLIVSPCREFAAAHSAYRLIALLLRFYRVDKMRSRDMGGTGLGLSIVKHLMKAHAGEMEIESTPGKGTTVSLNFPIFQ